MMAQYIVDSDDQETAARLVVYQNERVGTQTTVARVHSAIVQGLAAEAAFDALIVPGGQLEPLAEYHSALIGPLTESLDNLRAAMAGVRDAMEQLEAAVPGLFPGVTAQ
jgi:hypothetical protein